MFCVIVGEMLFNANYPSEPPDFIFINDQQFQPDIAELKVISATYLRSMMKQCAGRLVFL